LYRVARVVIANRAQDKHALEIHAAAWLKNVSACIVPVSSMAEIM